MSKYLGISKSTISYRDKKFAIKFVENSDCYFCKCHNQKAKRFKKNLPSQHFYAHVFDLLKDVYYQMASRNLTDSGLSITREKLLQVKKSQVKNFVKREIKTCDNCKKAYNGNTFLYVHVSKHSQKCKEYYNSKRKLHDLKKQRDLEISTRQKLKPKSSHEKIMNDIKNNFQYKMKLNFNILVNQVKIAGNSGNIENFNTCRKILAHENREKIISLFYCKSEEERENLRLMLQQAYVITHVMNTIGLINIFKF